MLFNNVQVVAEAAGLSGIGDWFTNHSFDCNSISK
jgi:hypothetical protein